MCTLQQNLTCALPSLPSVRRYIHKTNSHVTEGVLRCDELSQYLDERKLERVITLSEDAMRVAGRVQYDRYTNQIMGFALPLNKENGLPIPFSFPARNTNEMIEHFEHNNTISPLVNVIMAKLVSGKSSPPFCLLLHGTDNKNTTEDVVRRWEFINLELKMIGIIVVAFSTDSDPRYNTPMKQLSQLGKKSEKWSNLTWFNFGDPQVNSKEISPCYIQDTPYIETKMRNLLLRTKNASRKLPFGRYFIKQSHLKKIIVWFSIDIHNYLRWYWIQLISKIMTQLCEYVVRK